MRMVVSPERFDVIATTNMFGDIITDLGAVLQGGMGLAASGNLNPTRDGPQHVRAGPRLGPRHRRARGSPTRSPRCLSVAMMLDHLGAAASGRPGPPGRRPRPRRRAARGPPTSEATRPRPTSAGPSARRSTEGPSRKSCRVRETHHLRPSPRPGAFHAPYKSVGTSGPGRFTRRRTTDNRRES